MCYYSGHYALWAVGSLPVLMKSYKGLEGDLLRNLYIDKQGVYLSTLSHLLRNLGQGTVCIFSPGHHHVRGEHKKEWTGMCGLRSPDKMYG